MEGHLIRDGGDCTIHLNNKKHTALDAQLQPKNVRTTIPSGLHVIGHLSLQKESNKNELLERQMLSEFAPQPPKRERRTKPMFPEKMKSINVDMNQYLTLPQVPAYSPVEPAPGLILDSRSRKHACANKKLVTTADLKKPHISSLGVIPVRSSTGIPNLRVILEGFPAAITEEEVEPVRLCNTPVAPFASPELPFEEEVDCTSKKKRETKEKIMRGDEIERKQTETSSIKPAILPKVGTAVSVTLFQREKPPPKPSFLRGRRRQERTAQGTQRPDSVQSLPSSLVSGEINFTDEYDDSREQTPDNGDVETAVRAAARMPTHSSKDGSVASVEELLKEAREISSSESGPHCHQHEVAIKDSVAVFDRDKLHKKKHSKSSQQPESNQKLTKEGRRKVSEAKFPVATEEKRVERTVDEIIASLRDQSVYTRQTESDLRIQQIMNRVTARTSAYTSTGLESIPVDSTEDTSVMSESTAPGTHEGPVPSTDPEPTAISPASSPDFLSQIIESLSESSNTMTLSGSLSDIFTDDFGILDRKTEEIDSEWLSARTQTSEVVPVLSEEFEVTSQHYQMIYDTEESMQPMNIQQVWEDLLAPPEATLEDILSVRGEIKEIHKYRTASLNINSDSKSATSHVSLLSTWTQGGSRQMDSKQDRRFLKNIHHFCCMTEAYQLPQPLVHVGRKYHTPDRFPCVMPNQPYRFKQEELAALMEEDTSSTTSTSRIEDAASRVVHEVNKTRKGETLGPATLKEWQEKANCVIGGLDLSLSGATMQIRTDETQVYWSPAPPKLGAAPHIVKEMLFPQYYLEELDEFGQIKITRQKDEQSDSSEEEEPDTISPEDKAAIERTVLKRHNSAENVIEFNRGNVQGGGDFQDFLLKSGGQTVLVPDAAVVTGSDVAILQEDKLSLQRRPQTAPSSAIDGEHHSIPHDVNSALNEIREQKGLLEHAKKKIRRQETMGTSDEIIEQKKAVTTPTTQNIDTLASAHRSKTGTEAAITKLTPAEKALEAGRKYVILPKIKKKRQGKKLDIAKIEAVEKMLKAKPSGRLRRHASVPKLNRVIEREMKVPWKIRAYRASIPNLLDFEEYKTRKRKPTGEDEREWVRGIWNNWFDLVFPPTPEDSDNDDVGFQDQETTDKVENGKLHTEVVSDILSQDVPEIEPILNTSENRHIYQIILQEIEKLSDTRGRLTAFDFCRRGALYRKIGLLKKAEMDLDRAIAMEPDLLDAYWHRHLLYILQDRKAAAVDDLKFILMKNKQHSGAHRSMAEINKQQNDTTMAIINYSQAIKVNPLDHEAYFQRAQIYEQRGEMLLAMEDYAKAMKIMPSRTDAIMKHAMYYFENRNWQSAINDFTKMLKVNPVSATAYLYRGQAYAKLSNWMLAVQDFSSAIHHEPNNWKAFYMRACILRKAYPRKALQDFSVSLLLNDSEDNYLSYLHRGILYDTLGKPIDAIADFESVLKLQQNLAAAHVNIGLIFLGRLSNVRRAIQKFTAAISVDPTYVRGFVCRAEAYHRIHEVKKSLRDITRAIHMRPDVQHYYMYRGQYLLELGNHDLAAFCVHHASEMSMDNPASALGELPTQQAVVQAFLKNYDKAVEVLEMATKTKPIAPYFMLLARTHMKAKQFPEAITSFKEALDKMKPWQKEETWPPETAEAHYLTGLCYMELGSYGEALQCFNLAIKFNPSSADAYYQRGVAYVNLQNLKGILDFNRALALDPKMFQAYLSRACYYGMKGKYAKAILNCNEAIRLQPMSLRAYLYRGSLKYYIKAYDLAIMDLTKASSIDNLCPLPYFNRAVCYHETGQLDQALTDYSIVLILGDALEFKVLINRGLLYFERKDYVNALFDFQAAAKISPRDYKVLHTLGLCFHKLNQLYKAVAVFTRCLELQPFFLDGFIARGNAFMDYGSEQGLKFAKRDYQRVLHLDPMYFPARVNLAYAMQVSGEMMQAWKHFTAIIEVRPGYKPALEGRAIVNLQMSNTFGGFQDISQSINYGPTAELLTNRGVISQFMGDISMAMQDYQRAIKLDPGYSLAYFNAGNVYFYHRHFKQALDYYTKAVKYNPKDESAFLNRAITKVLLHDTTGALEDFDVAVKLSPLSAHIYFNRANLFASLQQYDIAETEYTRALELKPDDALMLKKRADARGKLGKQALAIEDYKRAVDIQTRPSKLILI